MKLRGRVIKKAYAAGSKSGHKAVFLQSPKGDFKIQLPDANPFSDPRLNALVGKSISATGDLDPNTHQFFISSWQEDPE